MTRVIILFPTERRVRSLDFNRGYLSLAAVDWDCAVEELLCWGIDLIPVPTSTLLAR